MSKYHHNWMVLVGWLEFIGAFVLSPNYSNFPQNNDHTIHDHKGCQCSPKLVQVTFPPLPSLPIPPPKPSQEFWGVLKAPRGIWGGEHMKNF